MPAGIGYRRRRTGLPSKAKAGKMLKDGTAHGQPLTKKQKGLFGMIRGGKRPMRRR